MTTNEVADSIAYCGLYANYVILLVHVMAVSLKRIVVEDICLLVVAISTIVVKNVGLTGVGNVKIFAVEKICFQIRMTLDLELLYVV